MTLKTDEFIRSSFFTYYPNAMSGYATSVSWQTETAKINIALCHTMMGGVKKATKEKRPETWQEHLLRICGIDVTVCPFCQKGKMCRIETAASRQVQQPAGVTQMRFTHNVKIISSVSCEKKYSFSPWCPIVQNQIYTQNPIKKRSIYNVPGSHY